MQAKYYYKDQTIYEGRWLDAPHFKDPSKILHREDGPAIEWASRTKEWYLNGKLHREDGPAIEWIEGSKFWYQNGKQLSNICLLRKLQSCKIFKLLSSLTFDHP